MRRRDAAAALVVDAQQPQRSEAAVAEADVPRLAGGPHPQHVPRVATRLSRAGSGVGRRTRAMSSMDLGLGLTVLTDKDETQVAAERARSVTSGMLQFKTA